MEIFNKRREMVRFRVLSEISKDEPRLLQKDIAERLDITVQAVSENIKLLVSEGYIISEGGKSPYKISQKGIAKLRHDALFLKKYLDTVFEAVDQYESVWSAIANENLNKSDKVTLFTYDGVLYASKSKKNPDAEVLENTKKGEDVPLSSLGGTIDIKQGSVIIVILPTINQGGSRMCDFDLIESIYYETYKDFAIEKIDRFGVMGTVSRAVASKLNIPVDIEFVISSSSISAAKKGLNVMALVVGDMAKGFAKRLDNGNIKYNIVDARILN
jgi:putative transcriptional regulator